MDDHDLKQDHPAHPLWALLVPIGSFLVMTFVYLLISATHGNVFSPWAWSPLGVFSLVTLVVFCLTASAVAIGQLSGDRFESWVRSGIDLDGFKGMRPIDAILSHYTNVATAGLFLGLLLYAGRHFVGHSAVSVAALTALVLLAILCLYGVLYSKFVLGIAGRRWRVVAYMAVCLGVLILDTLVMYMLLAGASSAPMIGS